jgi:hypothetical protein
MGFVEKAFERLDMLCDCGSDDKEECIIKR